MSFCTMFLKKKSSIKVDFAKSLNVTLITNIAFNKHKIQMLQKKMLHININETYEERRIRNKSAETY